MTKQRRHRSDQLLAALADYAEVVVTGHDTPDPDAIAAGWGVYTLVREKLRKPVRLIAGGEIVRAENLHMVRRLQPPLELVNEYSPGDGAAVVLVDCAATGANHLLGEGRVWPVGVIDHHATEGKPVRVKFRDIRPKTAASATIVGTYLREQQVEPTRELATALLYALRTEVVGSAPRFGRTDRGVLAWLLERADFQALRDIENAPLTRQYFEDLSLAISNTFLYDDVAVCFVPHAAGAEIVGEIADLLSRCTDVRRVLCGAVVDENLIVSARTASGGGDAVELLGGTLRGLGHWGGHRHRAGGKVNGSQDAGRKVSQALLDEIKTRWLKTCGVEEVRGTRLVAKREILGIL